MSEVRMIIAMPFLLLGIAAMYVAVLIGGRLTAKCVAESVFKGMQ